MSTRKTLWSDAMILSSVKFGEGMSTEARNRAFELADLGLIDMARTWVLTPMGEKVLSNDPIWKIG